VQDKHAGLKRQIQTIYARHKGRYGYRRITATLRQLGQRINHKTVQRLMRQLQIKSLVRPKKYRSYKGAVGRTAPNPPVSDYLSCVRRELSEYQSVF